MAENGRARDRVPVALGALATAIVVVLVVATGLVLARHNATTTKPKLAVVNGSLVPANVADANTEGYAFGLNWKGPTTASPASVQAQCVGWWKTATTTNYRPEWHWDRTNFVAGCVEAIDDHVAGRKPKFQTYSTLTRR